MSDSPSLLLTHIFKSVVVVESILAEAQAAVAYLQHGWGLRVIEENVKTVCDQL